MVHIKSTSIASVLALCATVSALPANKLGSTPALVTVDANVNLPAVHGLLAREEGHSAHKSHSAPHKGKSKNEEDRGEGKRSWRGRLGRRGPWRNDEELINVDLDNERHDHMQGDLIDIKARHNDEVIVEDGHRHVDQDRHGDVIQLGGDRYGDADVHEHIHRRHSHDNELSEVISAATRHRETGEVIHEHFYARHSSDRPEIIVKDDPDQHHGGFVHEHLHARHSDELIGSEHGRLGVLREGHLGPDDHEHDYNNGRDHDHDRHRRHDETVEMVGGEKHRHGTTEAQGQRGDVTVIHRDVLRVKTPDHHGSDVVAVDGEHRHNRPVTVVDKRSPGPSYLRRSTVIDSDRHGSTVVDVDRHDTIFESGRDTVVDTDRHGTIVDTGRHDTIVTPGHHDTTVISKRHSERIVVLGDDRQYQDTDVYYRNREAEFGRPIYFGQGEDFNRVNVVGGYPYRSVNYESYPQIKYGSNPPVRRGNGYAKRHGGVEVVEDGRKHHQDHHEAHNVEEVINHKRQSTDMGGAPGYIDVTSPVFNSTTAQRIASLVLSTNGTDANSTFVLNASNNIRTQVYLVPVNSTANSTGPIEVNLKVPIFVASSAAVEPYCATFDPSPQAPAPLTVMPCSNNDTVHASQKFLYNPDTGIIHPDWTPSVASQQLLQSMPDSIDEAEFTSAMTASTTMMAEAMETGSYTESMTASITAAPTYAAAAVSTSPPAITTAGPSSPTNSTSFTASPSNVTLIFSPSTPSVTESEAYEPETEADASQMNVKRQFDEPERPKDRGDRENDQAPSSSQAAPSPTDGDGNGTDTSGSEYESAPYTPQGYASQGYAPGDIDADLQDENSQGYAPSHGSNSWDAYAQDGAQAPMSAPQSYSAPYERR